MLKLLILRWSWLLSALLLLIGLNNSVKAQAFQPAANNGLPNSNEGWAKFLGTDTQVLNHAADLLSSASERANELILGALSYIGVRYQYGGNHPEDGFDCSGLVRWVFNRTWGMALPRRAAEMAKHGREVPREDIKPGDLVFFNTLKEAYSHVGIYLGNGSFIHAPSSGGGVRVENMNTPYWQKHWNGARRLSPANDTPPLPPPPPSPAFNTDYPTLTH